jgi:SSS family solute:Na+ symporter
MFYMEILIGGGLCLQEIAALFCPLAVESHESSMNWTLATLAACFTAVLWIGLKSRRNYSSSNDFLNASGSISMWAAALAFLAYNCGSIEVVGISAMAAQYGVQALHFYWIGGIPGMIFMGLVVLPIYQRAGARSIPEFLGARFGPAVRFLNACVSMIGTLCFAGVALYTLAQVLYVILGSGFLAGELVCAAVVLLYVLAGGVRGSIFTSVFQLFVMIAGLTPLLFLSVRFDRASWALRADRWHLWKPLPLFSPHAPLDCCGVILGLGFVISFSYWCTDFVMIQRALTAHSIEEARKVPLLAGFCKMLFAFLVVLPGVAAPSLLHGSASFDQTMPSLMVLKFGPVLRGVGTAALVAGLMAWLAGNVSGFSALWVEEIYRRFRPNCSEQHYIRAGQIAVPACLLLAQLTAFAAFWFNDIMEFLQLIVSLFYAPMFAIVLAGVLRRRVGERGAFAGICAGIASAIAVQTARWFGLAHFGSQMTANFYIAIMSFTAAMSVCLILQEASPRGVANDSGNNVVFDSALRLALRPTPSSLFLSAALLLVCLFLNVMWW